MTNEAKDQVPEWAQEAAAKIAAEAIELHTDQEIEGLSREIAAALLSAYRRGVEDSAQISDEKARSYERETWPSSGNSEQDKTFSRSVAVRLIGLSAAIRRLGEAE